MSFGTLTAEQAEILRKRYLITTATGDDLTKVAELVGIVKIDEGKIKCLHDQCPNCGGTGVRKDGLGLCFHGIACPCPKCSFTC